MEEAGDILPLAALEPFGWIFTPGPLPPDCMSGDEAIAAAGGGRDSHPEPGTYTEKGRYREEREGRRITLYVERPVWVVTMPPATGTGDPPVAEGFARHTVVDAVTGDLLTQFLAPSGPLALGPLDLHAPLAPAAMPAHAAEAAAIFGEERVLTGLPRTTEYGSRWRLLPGFVQVTDVWRVTFDTSTLPPPRPNAPPELAWVVLVDDKAGHRWLSAGVSE